MYASVNDQYIVEAHVVAYNLVNYNYGGGTFDTSTYTYTVPAAGYYIVYGQVALTGTGTAPNGLSVQQNGSQTAFGNGPTRSPFTGNTLYIATVWTLLDCDDGDTINIYYNSGSTDTIVNDSRLSYMVVTGG